MVEDDLYDQYLKDKAAREAAGEVAEPVPAIDANGEPIKRFNPKTDLAYSEAKKEIGDIEIGDEIRDEVEVPAEFGRMAAQTAKQVIIQKLREAERETLFNLYQDRAGEVINAMIQRVEGKVVFVDLGQAIAVMPPSEQVRSEVYKPGQRIKYYYCRSKRPIAVRNCGIAFPPELSVRLIFV